MINVLNIGGFLLGGHLLTNFRGMTPLTLFAILSMSYIFFKGNILRVNESCISINSILKNWEIERLIMGPLIHLDDMHLAYNMISFSFKGRLLEKRVNSAISFIVIMFILMAGSSLLTVILKYYFVTSSTILFWREKFKIPYALINPNGCIAGFSGVLFALQVIDGSLMSTLAELLLIQLMVPGSSFIGHLGGIMTGIIYIFFRPLLMNCVLRPIQWIILRPILYLVLVPLIAFQYDFINTPWTDMKRNQDSWFNVWKSSSTDSELCLDGFKNVIGEKQLYRLISGPLTHESTTHFVLCLSSLALKLYVLDKYMAFRKTLMAFLLSFITSPICFIVCTRTLTEFPSFEPFNSFCGSGLQSINFSLKVILFYNLYKYRGQDTPWKIVLFEITELFILLEPRTRLFHLSGIISGFCLISSFFRIIKFPGNGRRLLGDSMTFSNAAATKSWGYGGISREQIIKIHDYSLNEDDSIDDYVDSEDEEHAHYDDGDIDLVVRSRRSISLSPQSPSAPPWDPTMAEYSPVNPPAPIYPQDLGLHPPPPPSNLESQSPSPSEGEVMHPQRPLIDHRFS